jgi:hypothetical protein
MPIWVAVALTVSLAGCWNRLDVERPIDLVADQRFSDDERFLIEGAAEAWNLELGSQLRLVASDQAGDQRVEIFPSDFTCAFAGGVTHHAGSTEISICSLQRGPTWGFSRLVLHELGHVLNISTHADDPDAVMATGYCLDETDRRLFLDANPGFQIPGGCAVTHRLAKRGDGRPTLIRVGSQPVVVWGNSDYFSYQPLDGVGRPTGEERRLSLFHTGETVRASWPEVLPTATGFVMLHSEGAGHGKTQKYFSKPIFTRVTLDGTSVPKPRELSYTHMLLAAVNHGAKILLAGIEAYDEDGSRVVVLRQLDPVSVAIGPAVQSFRIPQISVAALSSFALIKAGEHTFALLSHAGGGEIHRLNAAGKSVERRAYPRLDAVNGWVHTTSVEGALLLLWEVPSDPASAFSEPASYRLSRVELGTGGALGASRHATLGLPGRVSGLFQPAVAAVGDRLWVATTLRSFPERAVIAGLRADTLAVDRPWGELGLGDCGSKHPALLSFGGRLLAAWAASRDGVARRDGPARSRCIE